ncbi:MAG TPA: TetR/AcrR family transcriptional regulator [Nevskiaceae bacterium]|nr:TetR/AcrR family transcriptional regulator [Nevskiaceae bacterium]
MNPSEGRRLEEKEKRREDILDAAERVFLEKGYEAAKMEDIAAAARVSRALLYVYFKDKSELQFGVCLRGLEVLRQRFEEVVRRPLLGRDKVAAIGRAYLGFAQQFPVYFSALSRFEAHRPQLQDEASMEHRLMLAGQAVHAQTVMALLAGQKDGSIRADIGDPICVAMTLWGFTHGALQLAQTKGAVFVHQGIAVADFLEQAIQMATRAVSSPPQPNG